MKRQENDVLTQVGPGTPMGRMLRQYWTPAIRSAALQADGAPVPVRTFAHKSNSAGVHFASFA